MFLLIGNVAHPLPVAGLMLPNCGGVGIMAADDSSGGDDTSGFSSHDQSSFTLFDDLEAEAFVEPHRGIAGRGVDGDGGVMRVRFDQLGEEGRANAAFALSGFDFSFGECTTPVVRTRSLVESR